MTNEEKFVNELIGYIFAYPDDDYMTMECLCRKLHKYGLIEKKDGEWTTDFIERKEKRVMRKRTPSEIKAYGDGYANAYKQFCHLLEKNDKDKAIREMEIFAKAVEITVETAMDEPSSSEIPNNCEHITEDGVTCAKYPACDDCLDNPLNKVKGSERLIKGKDEPTISKMEQVDKDINVRSKDKPRAEGVWNAGYKTGYDKGYKDAQKVKDSHDLVKDLVKAFCEDGTWLERQGVYTLTLAEAKQRAVDIIESVLAKDEPTIEVYNGNADKENWQCITIKPIEDEPQTGVSYSDHTDYDEPKTYVTWTEPQTDCAWK